MSLQKYTQARLVVQRPETNLYDAIRAMEENHIGCVLIHDGTRVAGIVTDRDLALEVIAFELDPFETELRDVATTPVTLLPVTASVEDAARLMLDRHVRRIPIVDGQRPVGIVTLDDLTLDQAVDGATLAAIVRAQLSEPSRLKRRGQARPLPRVLSAEERRARNARRHAARAKASLDALLDRTLGSTGLSTPERALVALETVVSAVAQRVRPDEARHLLAQLPSLIRERVAGPGWPPDRGVTRDALEWTVSARLNVEHERARDIVRQVGEALAQTISEGELADVRAQLPEDMKGLLSPAPLPSASPALAHLRG